MKNFQIPMSLMSIAGNNNHLVCTQIKLKVRNLLSSVTYNFMVIYFQRF